MTMVEWMLEGVMVVVVAVHCRHHLPCIIDAHGGSGHGGRRCGGGNGL